MTERRRHPFLSLYEWPLSNRGAILRLLERAACIALLPGDPRDQLSGQAQASFELDAVDHLELLLETVGLATRDGWTVDVERATPSGRLPDLHLEKGSVAFSVEVSRLAMDRAMRRVSGWCHRLHMIILSVEAANNVAVGGEADEEAVTGCDLDRVGQRLHEAAAIVRASGMARTVRDVGVRLTVARRDGPDAPTTFTGPPEASDPIRRLLARLRSKADQTAGGPPAWIRLDELGGLFQLTQWARSPLEQQLSQLHAVLIDALRESPHVRGLVLTDGSDPWGSQLIELTCAARGSPPFAGPLALVRRLPLGRSRRTFVIPNDVDRIELPPDLELSPGRWYAGEGSWLEWALNQMNWPQLDDLFI
jgi:hypothetical protein